MYYQHPSKPLLLLARVSLQHVDLPQLLPVPGIQETTGSIFAEPVVGVLGPRRHDLDPLHLAQLDQSIPAHDQRGYGRHSRDGAKSPASFFYEILEVHAVEASEEGAHGQTEGADAEFQVQEHEGVSVRI